MTNESIKRRARLQWVLNKFFETQMDFMRTTQYAAHPNQDITYILLPSFKIIRRLSFSRYIALTMYTIAKSIVSAMLISHDTVFFSHNKTVSAGL